MLTTSETALNTLPKHNQSSSLTTTSPSSHPHVAKRKVLHSGANSTVSSNSSKRKRVKKARFDEDKDLDLDLGINLGIGKLDRGLLADYVAQTTKRLSPNLSLVELKDLHIPGNIITNTVNRDF